MIIISVCNLQLFCTTLACNSVYLSYAGKKLAAAHYELQGIRLAIEFLLCVLSTADVGFDLVNSGEV